jgi:hypothetical protein
LIEISCPEVYKELIVELDEKHPMIDLQVSAKIVDLVSGRQFCKRNAI